MYEHQYSHQYYMNKPFGILFLTEQMSMNKGQKLLWKKGAEAVVAELRQLHYREAMEP
jgi:hypothetical protein